MTRKCPVRFGGGPTEKAGRPDLAGGLPYCGHKGEPESCPNPAQPLSPPTLGAAGDCGTAPVEGTPTRTGPSRAADTHTVSLARARRYLEEDT
jgi:hypothetical protein